MTDIFSKIISRELPAYIVHEDELVLAFLDIYPINKGQVLIVPKNKFVNIFDGDPETLAHMMKVAQKIAQGLVSGLKADGINILMNNGMAAGQEVEYAHMKVIPRTTNDNSFQEPGPVNCTEEELVETKNKLIESLK